MAAEWGGGGGWRETARNTALDRRTIFNHSSFLGVVSDISFFMRPLRERVRFVSFFPAMGSVWVAMMGAA